MAQPVRHGGKALMFARDSGIDYRDVMDFSANINPLGPSPKAIEAITQAMGLIRVYPDEYPVRLTRCLSERFQVPADSILAGNGATDLLYFWIRSVRPKRATLIVPTFVEYRRALESVGCEIETLRLNAAEFFRLPARMSATELVIVTNPNNPTGATMPPEEMIEWVGRFDASTQIFIDEAFIEFTAQPSLVRQSDRFPNLWILRSMTKFYALPGLRLGYLVGSGVRGLLEKREPWQVNSLAEAAGIASLEDRAYEEATLQLVQRERIRLWKDLQSLNSIHAFPTSANFFFASCASDEVLDRLISKLMENRILIRDCRGIEGLDGPHFRFGIKARQENETLLRHLRSI
ncbi:MAG: threonine-phosphate decarboxylase [Acidobacteria bacterium]|nr:MAG: threonine-phosphate decarboxylase [Acidobacteriota bacterium]